MNALMTRIYSAKMNGEDPILDQIIDDIKTAKDLKEVDTDEYKIVADGDVILIRDKVHKQTTRVVETPHGMEFECNIAEKSPNRKLADSNIKYLTNDNNELVAIGDTAAVSNILRNAPNYQVSNEFDLKSYQKSLTNKFSKFSQVNQSYFTKLSDRYAVLDDKGKLKIITDSLDANALVKRNPGWNAVREVEFRKSLQEKFAGFSEVNRNKIINNIFSAVENCLIN